MSPTRAALTFVVCTALLLFGAAAAPAAPNAAFDPDKMSDMSDFDPNNPVIPTGDTIKIAVVASYSGPAAVVGQIYFICVQWVAHDINKRGGIMVDGKRKLVEVIKANHASQPAETKKVAERMVLQEKVHVLWGTDGSHLMKIINQTADKYKVIAHTTAALSDELYDASAFTRYSFMSSFSTEQIGRAAGYYYGQVRKKEKKFYILGQDYLFGHSLADGFKKGLKEYYPTADLLGEDYHPLFMKDFAPYLQKIKASPTEVIFTGDWIPDAENLLVQARQMGVPLPFANLFLDEPNMLHRVGVDGTVGLVHVSQYGSEGGFFKTPGQIKAYKAWNTLWKTKWAAPYNTRLYEHGTGNIGSYIQQTYWLLSVMERAGSTDPEKIIKVWEGDSYQLLNGKVLTMRACDHKVIQDLHVEEYVAPAKQRESFNIPPYFWYEGTASVGPSVRIPAKYVLPKMDRDLARCKDKSEAGG